MTLATLVPCPSCNARRGQPCTEAYSVDAMTANWRTCAPHDERWNRLDHKMQSAFGEGRAAGERGRYLSDNPHAYESAPWEAWRLGFAEAQPRTGTHHPSNNSA